MRRLTKEEQKLRYAMLGASYLICVANGTGQEDDQFCDDLEGYIAELRAINMQHINEEKADV